MVRNFILSIFLFFLLGHQIYSQLKIGPLYSDFQRKEVVSDDVKSRNKRIEVVTDTVRPSLSINLISGKNPRCISDAATELVFMAEPINGGSNPGFEWFVNGVLAASDTNIFSSSSIQDKSIISCRLTSNLDCAVPKTAISIYRDTIIIANQLNPSIKLVPIAGIPACTKKESLTIAGIVSNGGDNPIIKWFYNDTLQAMQGRFFTRDSMTNGIGIHALMISNLNCSTTDPVTSDTVYTKVTRSILPTVSLKLYSVVSDNCAGKFYNFSTNTSNSGFVPSFEWYINGVSNGISSTGTFKASLPLNGDEVSVVMTSSIACANPVKSKSQFYQKADTLKLPFFDDFSTSDRVPSILRWIKNGGTFINNTFPVNAPTYNAATFDGLRYDGAPYDSTSIISRGVTDNLTSLPIDLSTYTSSDSIYLSFFWQNAGLGDLPEEKQGDLLKLYFKNSFGSWINVWERGGQDVSPFKIQMVNVKNDFSNTFLIKGFQFKFEATGRLAGGFDVWNLDYIYLNKGRTKDDYSFRDLSFNRQLKSILKEYTSMPATHFNVSPEKYLRDTISTSLNTLDLNNFINANYNAYLLVNNVLSHSILPTTSRRIDARENIMTITGTIDGSALSIVPPSEVLCVFEISGDNSNSDGKGIDYIINNTLAGLTILDNFYAYDDGSAERSIGINQKNSLVAYRFVSAIKNDTIKQVAIAFTRTGKALTDRTINLFISSNRPDYIDLINDSSNIYFAENKQIKYSSIVNNYTVYDINPPVILESDTFYVGYRQLTDEGISIGWDKNTNSNKNIFYYLSVNSNWIPFEDEPGSMMIRPVFGEYHYLLNNKSEINPIKTDFVLYPNPTSGELFIDQPYHKLSIYDINGVIKADFSNNPHLNISTLVPGIYIVKIDDGKNAVFKRLIKR